MNPLNPGDRVSYLGRVAVIEAVERHGNSSCDRARIRFSNGKTKHNILVGLLKVL